MVVRGQDGEPPSKVHDKVGLTHRLRFQRWEENRIKPIWDFEARSPRLCRSFAAYVSVTPSLILSSPAIYYYHPARCRTRSWAVCLVAICSASISALFWHEEQDAQGTLNKVCQLPRMTNIIYILFHLQNIVGPRYYLLRHRFRMKCNLNPLQIEFLMYAVLSCYFYGSNENFSRSPGLHTFLFLLASGHQYKVHFLPNSKIRSSIRAVTQGDPDDPSDFFIRRETRVI